MKAIFIDCWQENNKIALWLKTKNQNIKLLADFKPEIFIKASNIKQFQKKLKFHNIPSIITKKRSFEDGQEILVLKIQTNLTDYRQKIRYIESITNYKIEIFNADMKLEELFMFHKDIYPTANVTIKHKNNKLTSIKATEPPDKIKYKIPNLKVSNLKINTKPNLQKTFNTQLISIRFNNKTYKGETKQILNEFKQEFEEYDPDIIWTENGNLILPFLKQQFEKENISFNFNRYSEDDFKFKKGDSYFAYSIVYYRSASIFLKGRLHFDTRSFFADDTGFYGIIEGSRICRQRIQRIEMRSAGAAVTNLLLYIAYQKNYLLPYKIGMYEEFKTLQTLYQADRGAIIFEPEIGFHTDVVEFDYVSLYPQIMWKHNLSPETLYCKCCKQNKKTTVPGLNYNYCQKTQGIVSIVAENLIKRRLELKKENTAIAKEKSSYLKWLLVTMFGYQAFKNRKIGIIESHEAIQAYAREIILKTTRIAEELGWTVVHGIIDSVYVKKNGKTKKDIQLLEKTIKQRTGFHLNHEGNYKWIVFLPSNNNINQPVANHFYGIFEDGETKTRGIEARRKDSPKIIAEMQSEIIEKLSIAKNKQQFQETIHQVLKILRNYINSLPNATKEQLRIVRRISKLDYKHNIPQKIMVEQMQENGWDINPGQAISYIIQDSKSKNPKRRYISYDLFKNKTKFDIQRYTELMINSTKNMLQPFGVTTQQLQSSIQNEIQMTLPEYIKVKNT
jgi:DNA polymerase elongation subunit (family B)